MEAAVAISPVLNARATEMKASTKDPITESHGGRHHIDANGHSVLAEILSIINGRPPTPLQTAKHAIKILDRAEREAHKAEERWARFTQKGDHRPIAAVEKGKITAKKHRRQRSSARSSARRLAQRAELGARRFPREMSATAVVLLAMEPGRWYVRNQLRAACPELPAGSLSALLGGRLLACPALLEKAPNPAWDEFRGGLRPADTSPERRSRWRYRLTAMGGSCPRGNPNRPDAVDGDGPLAGRTRKRAGSASASRARCVATALRP